MPPPTSLDTRGRIQEANGAKKKNVKEDEQRKERAQQKKVFELRKKSLLSFSSFYASCTQDLRLIWREGKRKEERKERERSLKP